MFNKAYRSTEGYSINAIRAFQWKAGLILPSDYVYLLLNFNEFNLTTNKVAKIEDLAVLALPLYNLELFFSVNCDRSEDSKLYYEYEDSNYYVISDLMMTGVLLIGNNPKNSNMIYVEVPFHTNGVVKVANDFFELINEVIVIEE